ncbi:hypothetical protein KL86PLE_110088 [uncultured Pleomorphomonas sp.]|uniref:Uncharacterized protein n=1 Tax=uncultured Pleomorphomonas sp. TaxID=442121 RepID=A0A212L7G3_9HYPH|nr:hypothetical protein [uncultured Pleomorphomonas sp.]SCM73491.1 hypothetical protein KL86PLE_110088 [uncultured Pleomorphomonas sp.]
MTYLPKAAVGPAETFAASFFFGATPLAHKLSHFLSESEISSLVSGVISAALPHLGEPAYWAVHAASGVHIGLWPDKAHADEALREYEGGTITALYLAPTALAVTVKPLEWVETAHGWLRAEGYGVYEIMLGDQDIEAKKAAFQADHDARIRSALVDAPALELMTDEEIDDFVAENGRPEDVFPYLAPPATPADPVKGQMAEALRYAKPLVERYGWTQGDNPAYHAGLIAPIDAALAAYEKSTKVIDGITCEACGASLDVDRDFHTYTHDGVFLCHDCTWTYADMLSEPETFVLDDSGDETVYHTAETAKKVVDDYIASGGTITDKIGYRAWLKEKDATHAPA